MQTLSRPYAIDAALARSFLYRFLAKAFEDPTEAGWRWLTLAEIQRNVRTAVLALSSPSEPQLHEAAEPLLQTLQPATFDSFLAGYVAVFGHAARGRCPLNELEYGELKADPLFQPHRLADVAAFYGAFGLELAGDADERQDHLCLELEFMCVLAAKEAYALTHQLDSDELSVCHDAQKKFLREHLGRWAPAFTRRLAAQSSDPFLGVLARFTRVFIESECARFGVPAGGEDLLLRPTNEAAESLCASCGLNQLPPGALASV